MFRLKVILISLTLISVFTATAQENTYSIIIKMQNGNVLRTRKVNI